jgi:hypothetical protein
MGFGETLIFYVLIGAGVATAVFLTSGGRLLRTATAVVFWPIYLPVLLAPRTTPTGSVAPPSEPPHDEMAVAVAQVEGELEGALSSLDGWAEGVLAREAERIRELRSVWTAQAERIREMDRLLGAVEEVPSVLPAEAGDRRRQSEQARQANLARLRQVRRRAREDLMGTLAWVRELVSMIHLAKFTGAPASRAEELVGQIAAAVEGVSAVTWRDDFSYNHDSEVTHATLPAVQRHPHGEPERDGRSLRGSRDDAQAGDPGDGVLARGGDGGDGSGDRRRAPAGEGASGALAAGEAVA